ncbi:hypothetical protein E4T48_05467 [Aureobasidium sp. EXF-10727]|nr:hypothetical protein E4T48_05467 [Aureobasidium sp. EXF-10727]KAI4730539.1 hypothetical protein E4T49_01617 [Aureobasidium sp. EXF-10728]
MDKNNHPTSASKMAVEEVVKTQFEKVILDMIETHPMFYAIKEMIKQTLADDINAKVDLLIEKIVNEAVAKATLDTELKIASKMSATRAVMLKNLEDHLEFRTAQFQDFNDLVESSAIDAGEDTLGAGGPLTSILNVAHILHDTDNKVLERFSKTLEAELPNEEDVQEIEADIAAMAEKKSVKDEGGVPL